MDRVLPPFHLAFPVDNLTAAISFYVGVLGCESGRRSERWVDFNFFGHQLVAHLVENDLSGSGNNQVDGDCVPVPHFGLLLEADDWESLRSRLQEKVDFEIAPKVRFEGLSGEQKIMFLRDPAGNVLEFKSFSDPAQIFRPCDLPAEV